MLKQFWILTKNVLLRILFKGNTFKNSEFKIIQYLIKLCKTETSFLYHAHDFASELAPISTKLIFLVMYIYGKHARWLRKEASIVDIFKKGEWHKASDYCPVPLTPVSCKLLEHKVHVQPWTTMTATGRAIAQIQV